MRLVKDSHGINGLSIAGQLFISSEKVSKTDPLIGKTMAIPSGTEINYFSGGPFSTPAYSTGKILYVIRNIYNLQDTAYAIYVFNTYSDEAKQWSPAWVRAKDVSVIGGVIRRAIYLFFRKQAKYGTC